MTPIASPLLTTASEWILAAMGVVSLCCLAALGWHVSTWQRHRTDEVSRGADVPTHISELTRRKGGAR